MGIKYIPPFVYYVQMHMKYIPQILLRNIRQWIIDISVRRRFGLSTFWDVDVLVCRRFGLSTFWFVDVLVCRRFGLSTFRSVDVLVCRRFSLSTFWFVDVSVCRRFGLSTFWLSTFRFVDVLTSYRFVNQNEVEFTFAGNVLAKYLIQNCNSKLITPIATQIYICNCETHVQKSSEFEIEAIALQGSSLRVRSRVCSGQVNYRNAAWW